MDLTHSFTVPADIDTAWSTFMDLPRVGGCFPGATVTEADDEKFAGSVKVKLGPIALVYNGTGRFVEKDADAHRAVIEAQGKDRRGNGTAGATVTIQLTADGSGTRADVTTDLNVTGKPAQFGRGVMQDVSDKLLGQFVACIEGQFAPGPGAADAAAGAAAAGAAAAGAAAVGAAADEDAAGEAIGAAGTADDVASADATAARSEPPVAPSVTVPTPKVTVPGPKVTVPVPATTPSRPPAAELDLGSTVLPIVLRTYGGYLAAGLVGLVIGVIIARGRRRR